eukprot:79162_1
MAAGTKYEKVYMILYHKLSKQKDCVITQACEVYADIFGVVQDDLTDFIDNVHGAEDVPQHLAAKRAKPTKRKGNQKGKTKKKHSKHLSNINAMDKDDIKEAQATVAELSKQCKLLGNLLLEVEDYFDWSDRRKHLIYVHILRNAGEKCKKEDLRAFIRAITGKTPPGGSVGNWTGTIGTMIRHSTATGYNIKEEYKAAVADIVKALPGFIQIAIENALTQIDDIKLDWMMKSAEKGQKRRRKKKTNRLKRSFASYEEGNKVYGDDGDDNDEDDMIDDTEDEDTNTNTNTNQ